MWQEESVKMSVIPLMDPRMSAERLFHFNQIPNLTENNLQRIFSVLINTLIKRNLVLVPDIKMQDILWYFWYFIYLFSSAKESV